MSPHEKMTRLDALRKAYVVSFNFLGHPAVKGAEVLSHGPEWMEVRLDDPKKYPLPWFVNFSLVPRIEIEVLP